MRRKRFKEVGFYYGFFEKRTVPEIYEALSLKNTQKPIYKKSLLDSQTDGNQWFVKLFPSYLDFKRNHRPDLREKRIFRVRGFAINLNTDNVDAYLKKHFKPNFRTSLRRRFKGLETCFNVRYAMYHGHIEREEYEFIMHNLHAMLVRRFKQRNDKTTVLNKWDDYQQNTFTMINQKSASLFVIYHDSRPIQISLNYHYDCIFFLAIPSYDIDYAKFGLGNLAIKKLLEWCIEHSYKMLDMGYGAFDYKIKWCNTNYNFEHHLFYKRSSFISLLMVEYVTLKTQFINFLLAKNINVIYNQYKNLLLGKKKALPLKHTIFKGSFDKKEWSNFSSIDPISDASYAYLRKPLYDFAYARLENVSTIKVYEGPNKKEYCFITDEHIQKIVLEN
nr:GNAT family N-acetyltransferase [uncultured Allomuricauda sp.]